MNTILHDLNETQYEDLYHVDDAPLADLRVKALRRMGWWAVMLVAAGITLGFVLVLPDTIPTSFILKSERAEEIYRFPSTVYIERLFVKPGQKVKTGDVLLELSAPDIAALTQELASARANVATFKRFRTASATHERSVIDVNIRRLREDIALKESQVLMNEQKWAAESVRLAYDVQETARLLTINRQFYKDGDISKNDLNAIEANQVRAKSAYDVAYQNYLDTRSTLKRQMTAQQLEIKALENQLAKSTVDLQLEDAQLNTALATTRRRIEGAYGTFEMTENNHLRLKATRNGTVSFVFEGDKEALAGSILLKLIYEDAPLYAHTQVNSSQIGKIRESQSVVLKVDAYPVYEWGPAYGTVSNVSFTPDEKGQFNVQIRVTDEAHLKRMLRIGMRGKADVITDERTVFGHLFRKFRKTVSTMVD
ncbi:HlyD family secretion protein [Larkinella sp. VNQ87]|uniref:HlyD family secretion protein n=1 Tax=Larkinella sp. VNQ87 TaxID=3400921 RepID=UPI003C0ED3E2